MKSGDTPEPAPQKTGPDHRIQPSPSLPAIPEKREPSLQQAVLTCPDLGTVLDALPDGFCIIGLDMSVLGINQTLAVMLGISREAAEGMTCHELWSHGQNKCQSCPISRASNGEAPALLRTRTRSRHNPDLVLDISLSPWFDEGHKLAGFIQNVRNVADSTSCAANGNMLASIVESSLDAIISMTPEGIITSWNEGARALYGYSRSEALGRPYFMLVPEGKRPELEHLIQRVMEGRKVGHFETVRITMEGRNIDVSLTLSPIRDSFGKIEGVSAVARDITDEKLGSLRMRESEKRYRELCESSLDGYYRLNMDGRLADFNSTFRRMLGYDDGEDGELFGRSNAEITSPKWRDAESEIIRTEVLEKGFSGMYEKEYIRKDGTLIPVETRAYLLRDQQGSPKGFWGFSRDISYRKRSEERIQDEKEKLNVTLKCIGDAVISTDIEARVVMINEAAEKLTGWSAEEAAGQDIRRVFRCTGREDSCRIVEEVLDTGKQINYDQGGVLRHRNSGEIDIASSCSPITDRSGSLVGAVLVFRDITEQLRVEDELRRAQKLESVGLLAGRVAHEFNNILTASLTSVQLARQSLKKGRDPSKYLLSIEEATERAAGLTNQLTTFSKGGAPVRKPANINDTIRRATRLAAKDFRSLVRFTPTDSLWVCEVDSRQFSQAIEAMIKNAGEAMPEGGSISITTENVIVGPGDSITLTSGRYVRVTVSDTGEGIPKDNLDRVFDPFFSTREGSSGLGLTTAYSIVRSHSGTIAVDSEPGVGTTFRVYIPAISKPRKTRTPSSPQSVPRQGRILVLDDDDVIRDIVSDMLSEQGYNVTTTDDGDGAVREYREAYDRGGPFDAAILDLTIHGGKGGEDAAREIMEIDPAARCIVSSGYYTDPVMARYKDYGFVAAIGKPFKMEDMLSVVAETIGQPFRTE